MATESRVTLSHHEAARDMIVRIMAILTERLPELAGRTTGQLRRCAPAATVPDDFFEQVAVAIEAEPVMGDLHDLTSEESRDTIVRGLVYNAFADQLIGIGQSIRGLILEQRYDAAQRALAVYASVKSANRPNRKAAVSNVAALRRSLGRAGHRRTTPDPEPDTPR